MTLGMDRNATTHRRWQNTFLAGAIVFGLVALSDAMLTIYPRAAPWHLSEDGEFASELMIFVLAAVLMLGCVALGRRHDRKRAALIAEHEHWLPLLTERTGEGQVDLDVEAARLRPLALRSMGFVLVSVAVLVGVALGISVMSASADQLLKTGTRVPGEVLGAYKHSRGADTIQVSYTVGYDDRRFAEIVWDSDQQYAAGQQITVIVDRANPDRVRTLYDTNDDQTFSWVLLIGMIVGVTGLVLSISAAVNWWRRYRAVLATGWRVASVTVVPDYPVRRTRHMPDIHVEYRDGSRITLRAATSTHGSVPLKKLPNRRAWIGGTDRDMVVLFPHGRRHPAPYAVPAYALNLRAAAQPEAEAVPEDPAKVALVKRTYRLFMVAMGVWYAVLIAAATVLFVLDLLWPLFFVVVVGSLGPIPLAQIYFTRMRAALEK
jgi:hypothetical protein